MKPPQLLTLLQRGDDSKPTVYKFSADETLYLYNDTGGTVEICDKSGAHIRMLDRSWLMSMGYSPAKLLAGHQTNQFLSDNKLGAVDHIKNSLHAVAFSAVFGVALLTVGHITGCTNYIAEQIDKDIAATTVAPVENYYQKIEFKRANEHANQYLAKTRQ